MEIYWKNKKLRLQLEDLSFLQKKYDIKTAHNIVKRLQEIKYSPSYVNLPPSSRKHSIKDGKKFKYFAVDLPSTGSGRGKWRLIFIPYGKDVDMSNQKTITSIEIMGIIDYH